MEYVIVGGCAGYKSGGVGKLTVQVSDEEQGRGIAGWSDDGHEECAQEGRGRRGRLDALTERAVYSNALGLFGLRWLVHGELSCFPQAA